MQAYGKLPAGQKKAFWQNHLAGWQESFLSKKEYCKNHNLKLSTFGYWLGRLNKDNKTGTGLVPVSFTPAKISDPTGIPLELALNNFYTLIIPQDFDRQHLTRVLDVLEGRL